MSVGRLDAAGLRPDDLVFLVVVVLVVGGGTVLAGERRIRIMNLEAFRRKPLMGIVRGLQSDDLEPVIEHAIEAGLETLEITMNTAGAAELIRRASEIAGGRLTLGAGTVLEIGDLEAALDAGATFAVLPAMVDEVVNVCVERGVAVFPGALTPTEVYAAWRAGAAMVKVFPAQVAGPDYFRELKGPFGELLLLACGGVSAENLGTYARAGADAFAFGGSVFRAEWMASGEYERIADAIRGLVTAYNKVSCIEV